MVFYLIVMCYGSFIRGSRLFYTEGVWPVAGLQMATRNTPISLPENLITMFLPSVSI